MVAWWGNPKILGTEGGAEDVRLKIVKITHPMSKRELERLELGALDQQVWIAGASQVTRRPDFLRSITSRARLNAISEPSTNTTGHLHILPPVSTSVFYRNHG